MSLRWPGWRVLRVPAWARSLGLALLLPGLLLAATGQSRGGLCLESYAWAPGDGWVPTPEGCPPDQRTPALRSLRFYGGVLGGVLRGEPGRSREDASQSWPRVLAPRVGRSVGILGVASLVLAVALYLPRRAPSLPRALPLPLAGYVLFVLVIRLTPPGSPLDYDRAGPLWAGLALGLADGLGATLALGSRTIIGRETARPYAQAQDLAGASGLDAARDVAAPERASLLRGAVLALLGGLPVVESIFDVQGLGETVRDLVVDRRGLDPLLLSSTLLLYALLITVVLHLPWEWLARRLP